MSCQASSNTLQNIADAFRAGSVVPFLGPGINYGESELEFLAKCLVEKCGSPRDLIGCSGSICWAKPDERPLDCPFLPKDCPLLKEFQLSVTRSTVRCLSQYLKLEAKHDFYEQLRNAREQLRNAREQVDQNPISNCVYDFLAGLPFSKINRLPYQLIVTTNHDDLLESYFHSNNKPFDLVFYIAEGTNKGRFKHKPYNDEKTSLIELSPQSEYPLPWGERPIILKLYGIVSDDFVITEEHRLNYLTTNPVLNVLPIKLLSQLRYSHLLFLGCSLNDFELQMILQRLIPHKFDETCWFVHHSKLGDFETKLWEFLGGGSKEGLIQSTTDEDFISSLEKILTQEKVAT